ncbi:hypothetical protein [Streptomyces sp. NBC_00557]|uniref:hypothetical protein n=1 Tax=Streptomyces sp. NBC_00557 TaxID=2975776 RepID=UPI002E7FD1F9|nr:hypothetical protein [Streptomyces sp. NBC_00557]WUC39631.1 hypothetical protein OG956_38380 [Streptomyces sp. NBC_00557]
MGKHERRRKRQRAAAKQQQPANRVLYPNAEQPLLEVHIQPGTPDDVAAMCRQYWEFTTPGQWTRHVSAIGSTSLVYKAVRGACRAEMLNVVCPKCAAPTLVTSRSDMAATVCWGPDFPTEPVEAAKECPSCAAAEAAARRAEAERAKEEQQRQNQNRVDAAGAWLREQAERDVPDAYPSLVGALTLLSMVEIMQRKDTETIGPLQDLNYTLTASPSTDIDVFRTLHQDRWICPTTPATTDDFAFDGDTVRGVYITQIPWKLAPSLGGKITARREITDLMSRMLRDRADKLRQQVQQLEAGMAVDYLEGLLTRKYNEEPIPEHRLPDAYEMFLGALHEGFTLGQLVAIAWSSAAGSVAWGQRTPGLKPGSVSAASVTSLERRIGYARDRRIEEYDVPNWVPRPAIHATALRLLKQQASEIDALSRFRTLKQRTDSRALEAAELDGDIEDLGEDQKLGETMDSWLEDLRAGRKRESNEPPITYALVTPDGSLEFHSEPVDQMRFKVGEAGAGLVDRITLPDPSPVHAYVGELVRASDELANPVADEMLRLLDCHDGPFYGPISFFAVGPRSPRPRSLDEDQQEMLRAAHEVARSRAGLN